MLKTIKLFFEKLTDDTNHSDIDHQHAIQLAVSVLLVEMMRIDGNVSELEKDTLKKSLDQKFELTDVEKNELMALANQELNQSIDYYQFTSVINQHFNKAQKVNMIEELWRVAFADGKLDAHEEHYIRKVNALIHVSHNDFMSAKHRART
ncbi:MAG: TerB family tellurite resistance protein [Kangiellaceae bacterium]